MTAPRAHRPRRDVAAERRAGFVPGDRGERSGDDEKDGPMDEIERECSYRRVSWSTNRAAPFPPSPPPLGGRNEVHRVRASDVPSVRPGNSRERAFLREVEV